MLAYSSLGDGPVIVLLHAFPLDRTLWRDVVEPIAAHGWSVITPDLPGFGDSPGTMTSMAAAADDVAALLDSLGIERVVIGGCSMGGYVAMAFARAYRTRTAGIVLVDTKANADDEGARANRARIAEQVERAGNTEALAVTQPDLMLAQVTRESRADVVDWLQDTIRKQSAHAVANAQRAMADRDEQFAMLADLRVPVLCMRGDADAIATAADHTRMATAAADGLDITIADAGHLVPIENPAAFSLQMERFLTHIHGNHCA